ncbi:hypothetical protein CDD80_3246 [Ophiocordyceps camponoti-rufipedis]|uniref:Uncharacterized protein n=1 Tax=Ophiocordyceps camponoti-rufipedis TaxID=2004952 RepID=A0A2C5Y810_9HYPO|nr:hypothetical protein CDD80_3246 [Ophiocordyceps camponoti-rufipedis]
MHTLRRTTGRLPVLPRAALRIHTTAPTRLAYKDSQDRNELRPRSNEHTLSGRDDDASSADADAAFDGSQTRPEAEKRRAGGDGAVAAGPADQGLSKPRGDERDGRDRGPGVETEKGGASRGASLVAATPRTHHQPAHDVMHRIVTILQPSILLPSSASNRLCPQRPPRHSAMAPPPPVDLSDLPASTSPSSANPSQHEAAIINLLSATVNDADPSARSAADALDKLYPAGQDVGVVEDFLWSLWSLLVGTVKKIPAHDARQKLLVDIVARLRDSRDDEVELWGQKTRVWSELPMLGPCMRDAWNLRPKPDGSDKDNAAILEWTSLNSFAARMFGADLQPWVNLAIWELRAALEEAPPSTTTARDAAIATVCEWIAHARHQLHRQGRQPRSLDAMEERALQPGKLFEGGQSGLSDARWRFWRERLAELGPDAGSAELRDRAKTAVAQMEELETST